MNIYTYGFRPHDQGHGNIFGIVYNKLSIFDRLAHIGISTLFTKEASKFEVFWNFPSNDSGFCHEATTNKYGSKSHYPSFHTRYIQTRV